jgi:hypothetical protein
MVAWAEFAAARPDLAELGLKQLRKFGLAYLGTTRKDGSPRVNPVCPVIADGRVFVATPPTSPKLQHLLHDGRYVLHLLPGKQEEEFWIRGIAKHSTDPELRARVVEAAVGITRIQPEEWLFEYDIEEAGTTLWADFQTPAHRPVRTFWRAP